MHIIDRRRDPGGKSLANRQRFIRRARDVIRRAVREAASNRSIRDIDQGGDVRLPADGVHEPVLRHAPSGGRRSYVLPGNRDYVAGDRIPRPDEAGGAAGAGADGDGEDDFSFVLSREEFLDLFLEDLELPDLAKRQLMGLEESDPVRAGYRPSGPPASLSVARTLRHSLSRRTALRRPGLKTVNALREEISRLENEARFPEQDNAQRRARLEALREELAGAEARMRRTPFIDPLDLRYRRYDIAPRPIARAVMFCLMDVSGSMDEHRKDLAKRFYTLLYLFLKRRYERLEVVFIRHTHEAMEVDEDTFFHARESGGTVVSTALGEMMRIVRARFPVSEWNIYAAQASDGDNLPADNADVLSLLTSEVLPACQFYAYLEVGHEGRGGEETGATSLWRAYDSLPETGCGITRRRVAHRADIFPVFRDLFTRARERV